MGLIINQEDVMKKRIILLLVNSLVCVTIHAASEQLVWDDASLHLTKYNLSNQAMKSGMMQLLNHAKQSDYELKPVEEANLTHSSDIRYQIFYKNIPVWEHQLILHKRARANDFVSGIEAWGIERDVQSVDARISKAVLEQNILATVKDKIIFKNMEQIIYLDDAQKAHLAYLLSMYTNNPDTFVAAPQYIIDANSGVILKQWDNLSHKKMGQGLGGNVMRLPYRNGLFQYGSIHKDLPSLGKFDVTIKGDQCYVETPEIRVFNIAHSDMDKSDFPVLSIVEFYKNLSAFYFHCTEKNKYYNKNDGDTAPANYSFSAVNDTMYFARATLDMYKKYYGVQRPIGDDLPLRAYTHIKNFDNAFATPSIKFKGIYLMHQQIVIGDGEKKLTAPAQGTLAHELSHNFTRLHSNLTYKEQSGGINEAFSDMASIALFDYIRKDNPWYWDGNDWSIGSESTLGAAPIRYMDEPTKDGISIDHVSDYKDQLDVHQTSGVFNKAFYLLANKPDWSIRQAFQVMIDANIKYWTPGTHFEAASCGVIQAAKDRKYKVQGVVDAFAEVGVVCPLKAF